MAHDSQRQVPPAFVALYIPPGRQRPAIGLDELLERHELCEDLSAILVEQARGLIHELGITEDDVLQRIHRGLAADGSPVSGAEAGWVVGRLAEHLGWEAVLPRLGIVAAGTAPQRSRSRPDAGARSDVRSGTDTRSGTDARSDADARPDVGSDADADGGH